MSDVQKLREEIVALRTEVKLLKDDKTTLQTELKYEIEKRKEAEVNLDNLTKLMNKVGLFPYLRMKFELYSATWDCGWRQMNFNPLDSEIPVNLFNQTRESFTENWKRWNRILEYSSAPGAKEFLRRMKASMPNCSTKDVAKHVALILCFLNNSLHGPVGMEALAIFNDVDKLIATLQEWNMTDPYLLQIARVFEEVTTGK